MEKQARPRIVVMGAGLFAPLAIAAMPASLARLFSLRSGVMPKLVLAAGISYLFLPIDLIPDRLGWIGHLDEAGFLLLGLVGGLLLSAPREVVAGPAPGLLAKWAQRLAWQAGRLTVAGAVGRLVLRTMLGRWPDAAELVAFRAGLDAGSHGLPPLLRACAYVPAAGPLLSRSMLLSAQRGSAADPTRPGRPAALAAAQMMGDPLTIWRGPRLRFLHLEKTAGSSLINVLAAQFHPLQIDADPDRNYPPHERRPFPHASYAAQRDAALVWGHYDLPSLRRLDAGSEAFTLCVFREPGQRILSLYYYWRANQADQAATVRCARETGLLAFLRTRDPLIVNYIDNLYVRRLTGLYATAAADPVAQTPDDALDAALACLSTLDFVGMSGRLDDSLALLGKRIGFTPPLHTPQVNVLARSERNSVLPYRPTPRETVTPEIAAELERLTRLDRVLYRQVEQRFEHELAGTRRHASTDLAQAVRSDRAHGAR